MATLRKKIEAERRMRELLESGGLPEPDRIEYDDDCIRLFFEATRTVVVIDLDEETGSDPERGRRGASTRSAKRSRPGDPGARA